MGRDIINFLGWLALTYCWLHTNVVFIGAIGQAKHVHNEEIIQGIVWRHQGGGFSFLLFQPSQPLRLGYSCKDTTGSPESPRSRHIYRIFFCDRRARYIQGLAFLQLGIASLGFPFAGGMGACTGSPGLARAFA